MENSDGMQQELFQEFDSENKKKRKKASNSGILPKNYILFNVSYEHVIFISIAVIMLMVLLFSLGVERGKQIAYGPQKKVAAPSTPAVKETRADKPPKEVETKIGEEVVKKPAEEKPAEPKKFTIQIVAYRSKRLAQKELISLGKKGYSPFIVVGGGYYQICVGEYESQDAAKKDFTELKKLHKDTFIRKR